MRSGKQFVNTLEDNIHRRGAMDKLISDSAKNEISHKVKDSILLLYTIYKPVFYATHDQHFPSDSEERAGFWVGFAEHCGDSLTHMVLDAVTNKIIYRSALRSRTPKDPNKRLVDAGGEEEHQPHENPAKDPTPVQMGEVSSIRHL